MIIRPRGTSPKRQLNFLSGLPTAVGRRGYFYFMAELHANANQSPQIQSPIFDVDGLIVRIEQVVKNAFKQPVIPGAVYSYEELAQITGFSISTIIRADRKGRLAGRYEGRRRFFLGEDVLKWLANREGDVQ